MDTLYFERLPIELLEIFIYYSRSIHLITLNESIRALFTDFSIKGLINIFCPDLKIFKSSGYEYLEILKELFDLLYYISSHLGESDIICLSDYMYELFETNNYRKIVEYTIYENISENCYDIINYSIRTNNIGLTKYLLNESYIHYNRLLNLINNKQFLKNCFNEDEPKHLDSLRLVLNHLSINTFDMDTIAMAALSNREDIVILLVNHEKSKRYMISKYPNLM